MDLNVSVQFSLLPGALRHCGHNKMKIESLPCLPVVAAFLWSFWRCTSFLFLIRVLSFGCWFFFSLFLGNNKNKFYKYLLLYATWSTLLIGLCIYLMIFLLIFKCCPNFFPRNTFTPHSYIHMACLIMWTTEWNAFNDRPHYLVTLGQWDGYRITYLENAHVFISWLKR